MALNMLSKLVLNKSLTRTKARMAPMFMQNHQTTRAQSIDAASIINKSPYEEVSAKLDAQSSKSNPMKVNAYGDERTIACVCDDMHFMTLKKGPPVKCKCGYWFQLVDANKFWETETESS